MEEQSKPQHVQVCVKTRRFWLLKANEKNPKQKASAAEPGLAQHAHVHTPPWATTSGARGGRQGREKRKTKTDKPRQPRTRQRASTAQCRRAGARAPFAGGAWGQRNRAKHRTCLRDSEEQGNEDKLHLGTDPVMNLLVERVARVGHNTPKINESLAKTRDMSAS